MKIIMSVEIGEGYEKWKELLKDPEIAKARTEAGVKLDTQEVVFLVE